MISPQLIRVYSFVKGRRPRWFTALEVAQGADVAPRTARHHLTKLVKAGVFEQTALFPGYRYRALGKVTDPAGATLTRQIKYLADFSEERQRA